MKITEGLIKTIEADPGKVFADKEGNEVGTVIYLGKYDSQDNYTEINKEE